MLLSLSTEAYSKSMQGVLPDLLINTDAATIQMHFVFILCLSEPIFSLQGLKLLMSWHFSTLCNFSPAYFHFKPFDNEGHSNTGCRNL